MVITAATTCPKSSLSNAIRNAAIVLSFQHCDSLLRLSESRRLRGNARRLLIRCLSARCPEFGDYAPEVKSQPNTLQVEAADHSRE